MSARNLRPCSAISFLRRAGPSTSRFALNAPLSSTPRSRAISSSSISHFRSTSNRWEAQGTSTIDSNSGAVLDEAAQGEKAIYDKLKAKFGGKQLEVQDVSGGCGSFYAIHISSPLFRNLSTIKQHRLVNECLKEEVKSIHGLQLKTVAEPEE